MALRELAALFPEDRFVHVALGDMLRHEEEYTQSAESYSEAIKLIDTATTSDWRTFYVRGIAYERMDEWDKAEADFRRSLELSPDQPLVLNYLGYSLVEPRAPCRRRRLRWEPRAARFRSPAPPLEHRRHRRRLARPCRLRPLLRRVRRFRSPPVR